MRQCEFGTLLSRVIPGWRLCCVFDSDVCFGGKPVGKRSSAETIEKTLESRHHNVSTVIAAGAHALLLKRSGNPLSHPHGSFRPRPHLLVALVRNRLQHVWRNIVSSLNFGQQFGFSANSEILLLVQASTILLRIRKFRVREA